MCTIEWGGTEKWCASIDRARECARCIHIGVFAWLGCQTERLRRSRVNRAGLLLATAEFCIVDFRFA
jgi:hypothetical protein